VAGVAIRARVSGVFGIGEQGKFDAEASQGDEKSAEEFFHAREYKQKALVY
jgi:hypothetical protein